MTNQSPLRPWADATSGAAAFLRGVAVAALALAISMIPAAYAGPDATPSLTLQDTASAAKGASPHGYADFGTEQVSPDVRHVADWIAATGDSAHAGFVIVDKKFARVYVFDAETRLRGSSPVLLGAALGDDSVADIGSRPIADVRLEERTTPAGRFVAERGHNALHEDVIWVDYDAAVSMHRVRTTNSAEHRLKRLATPTVEDNRISYGCINVPVAFYEAFIRPLFIRHPANVYVLPDVKSVQEVFGSYGAAAAHVLSAIGLPSAGRG